MTTTTIRIEGDLKARITAAAARAGTTARAFMLKAIATIAQQCDIHCGLAKGLLHGNNDKHTQRRTT